MIEWNDIKNGEPLESKSYLVTVRNSYTNRTYMKVAYYYYDCYLWTATTDEEILAWAEIEPFVEYEEFKVGDIVVNHNGFVGVVTNAVPHIVSEVMYVMWTDGSSEKYENIKNINDGVGFKKIGTCTDEFENVLNILEDAEDKL